MALDFDALAVGDVVFEDRCPETLLAVGRKFKTVVYLYPAHLRANDYTVDNRVVFDKQHATKFLRVWERDADLQSVYFVPVNWLSRGIIHQRRKVEDIPKTCLNKNMFLTLNEAQADVERRRKLKHKSLLNQLLKLKQTVRVVKDF